jgi:hypothetical protein
VDTGIAGSGLEGALEDVPDQLFLVVPFNALAERHRADLAFVTEYREGNRKFHLVRQPCVAGSDQVLDEFLIWECVKVILSFRLEVQALPRRVMNRTADLTAASSRDSGQHIAPVG